MSYLDYVMGRLKRGIIAFINAVILANWDLPFEDYLDDSTLEVQQSYQVGKNNQLGRGDQHKLFVSKLTPIMCTTNTLIAFNSAENNEHLLLANTWYNFKINIYMIHYRYQTEAGTIYCHFGGVLPQEARRPE